MAGTECCKSKLGHVGVIQLTDVVFPLNGSRLHSPRHPRYTKSFQNLEMESGNGSQGLNLGPLVCETWGSWCNPLGLCWVRMLCPIICPPAVPEWLENCLGRVKVGLQFCLLLPPHLSFGMTTCCLTCKRRIWPQFKHIPHGGLCLIHLFPAPTPYRKS